MKLALDAMGGDNAPRPNIEGAKKALLNLSSIEMIYLVGDETILKKECKELGLAGNPRIEIVHATEVIAMDESGLVALRKKKNSSMSIAVDLVKQGRADAVLSAGNTGAAVAASTIKLRLLPGVERAGIISPIPSQDSYILITDTGANPDAKPSHLIAYAIMGSLMARYIYNHPAPKVAVMSNGTEDGKGCVFSKECHKMFSDLKERGKLPFDYVGNCEGHDLFNGEVQVALTDGFVGNVMLKSIESTAKAFSGQLKSAIKQSIVSMLGALLMKSAFGIIRNRMSADAVGGSPLMGVNGVSIIAHGSANARAIYNAIRMAEGMCRHDLNGRIVAAMAEINADDETAES